MLSGPSIEASGAPLVSNGPGGTGDGCETMAMAGGRCRWTGKARVATAVPATYLPRLFRATRMGHTCASVPCLTFAAGSF